MKKIIVLLKEPIDKLPPVFNLIRILPSLGIKVTLITSNIINDYRDIFDKLYIDYIDIPNKTPLNGLITGYISKLIFWLKFRKVVKKYLDENKKSIDLIWIASGDTAIAIKTLLKDSKYILHLHELYDNDKIYLKLLKKISENAYRIVVPDASRAIIFRYWFNLKTTPFVLPNKTILSIQKRNQNIPNEANAKKITGIKNKKLILYQAKMIRMELYDIAKALLQLGDDYILGILGDIRDHDSVNKLKQIYPNLVQFEYMPPPYHLTVTSHAYIGLLIYNYESLNNIFCAPNKVWEYSCLGLPMLANNLPTLTSQFNYFNSGMIYEFDNITSIVDSLKKIDENYEHFCNGALNHFNSIDITQIITKILNENE